MAERQDIVAQLRYSKILLSSILNPRIKIPITQPMYLSFPTEPYPVSAVLGPLNAIFDWHSLLMYVVCGCAIVRINRFSLWVASHARCYAFNIWPNDQ